MNKPSDHDDPRFAFAALRRWSARIFIPMASIVLASACDPLEIDEGSTSSSGEVAIDELDLPEDHELSLSGLVSSEADDASADVDESSLGETSDQMLVPEALKVAYFGDQGAGTDAESVLQLIVDEGADLILVLGDLGYHADAERWYAQIEAFVPPTVPVLAVVGNHESHAWSGYHEVLAQRVLRVPGLRCIGTLGVNSACLYRGLLFVLSGTGVLGSDHSEFSKQIFEGTEVAWKICAWHKNKADFQVGHKVGAEVDWDMYRLCQSEGAMIATAHEHSYERTYTLTDMGNRAADHGKTGSAEEMQLDYGRSFVFVSGLGGKSIRDFEAEHHMDDGWWSTIFTSNVHIRNGVEIEQFRPDHGALFIDYNTDGRGRRARGYFKTVGGDVVDEFEIVNAMVL